MFSLEKFLRGHLKCVSEFCLNKLSELLVDLFFYKYIMYDVCIFRVHQIPNTTKLAQAQRSPIPIQFQTNPSPKRLKGMFGTGRGTVLYCKGD